MGNILNLLSPVHYNSCMRIYNFLLLSQASLSMTKTNRNLRIK